MAGKLGGGQYFAAEGRDIEGPPPGYVYGSFPKYPQTCGESDHLARGNINQNTGVCLTPLYILAADTIMVQIIFNNNGKVI